MYVFMSFVSNPHQVLEKISSNFSGPNLTILFYSGTVHSFFFILKIFVFCYIGFDRTC